MLPQGPIPWEASHPTTMIPDNPHSFSRPFAEKRGQNAAIILKYLRYMCQHHPKHRDGKPWHFASVRKLATKMPYLSASTIASCLRKLETDGLLEISNHNHWKQDRTQWFHVADEHEADLNDTPLRFDPTVAKKHGINAALVHFNLFYQIRTQVRRKIADPKQVMSPKFLADHLPMSASAVKRALKTLDEFKLIVKCDDERATYTLPKNDILLLRQMR